LACASCLANAAPKEKIIFALDETTDGVSPYGALIVGGTTLYGTALQGGSHGCGTIFSVATPGGQQPTPKILWTFAGGSNDGCMPYGRLTLDSDGSLIGTTYAGGTFSNGTVFRLTSSGGANPTWSIKILWSFGNTGDGLNPSAGVTFVNGTDSSAGLYGTTTYGGKGYGTVYRLKPPANPNDPWIETVIYKFANGKDGAFPWGGVLRDMTGLLYGTTNLGGSPADRGVVFRLTPVPGQKIWDHTPLYRFKGAGDGGNPGYVDLIAEFDGSNNITALYGTAESVTITNDQTCGVAYKLTTADQMAWSWSKIANFPCTGNRFPRSGLAFANGIDAMDGVYGVTRFSVGHFGSVFKLTPTTGQWTRTTLWKFTDNDFDGDQPVGAVTVLNGKIYGTTIQGGTGRSGTVFRVVP
jgi:uncharacterized repeat protein (TIGR03803 family)